HLLAEVELLCDRVAIIKAGRLLYVGTGAELRRPTRRFVMRVDDWPRLAEVVRHFGGAAETSPYVDLPPEVDMADVVTRAVQAGLRVSEVTPQEETLEELYLKVSES